MTGSWGDPFTTCSLRKGSTLTVSKEHRQQATAVTRRKSAQRSHQEMSAVCVCPQSRPAANAVCTHIADRYLRSGQGTTSTLVWVISSPVSRLSVASVHTQALPQPVSVSYTASHQLHLLLPLLRLGPYQICRGPTSLSALDLLLPC